MWIACGRIGSSERGESAGRPRMRRVAGSIALPLLLLFTGPCAAAAAPQPVCAAAQTGAAKSDPESLHRAFRASVRSAPTEAVELACAEIGAASTDRQSLSARVDLASALIEASRENEALLLLDDVVTDDEAAAGEPGIRVHLNRALAYKGLGDIAREGAELDRAEDLARRPGNAELPILGEVLVAKSSRGLRRLDLDGAELASREALSVYERLGLSATREGADVYNQLSVLAYTRQDYPTALAYATREIETIRAIGGPDDRELLFALGSTATIRSIQADYDGAEAALTEALRIAGVHADSAVDARLDLLQAVAGFHLDRGHPAEALAFAEEAVRLSSARSGETVAAIRPLMSLAAVYSELGRYGEARRELVRGRALFDANDQAVGGLLRLVVLLTGARLDLRLGNVESARDDLRRAAAVSGTREPFGYWNGWRFRLACRLDAIEGRWRAADDDCARSIEETAAVLDAKNPLVFDSLVGRCYAQTSGDIAGTACDSLRAAIADGQTATSRSLASAFVALAARERNEGRLERAIELQSRAVAAAELAATPDPLWMTEYALAEGLAAAGNRPLAIFFGKRSVAAIEQMRDQLGADGRRFERGFLSDKFGVYRALAAWLLEERRDAEAIAILGLLKIEERFDFIERSSGPHAPSAVGLSETEEDLQRRFLASVVVGSSDEAVEAERLAGLRASGKITPDEERRLRRALDHERETALRRAHAIMDFLESEHRGPPLLADRSDPSNTIAGSLAGPLARDQAVAYLFVAGARLHVVFVTRRGVERVVAPIDVAKLQHSIADYLADLSARRDVRNAESGRVLFELLGAPLDRLARARDVRRLDLWLDGSLRYVPFPALWDGRRYLVERYEFSYRPGDAQSASVSEATKAGAETATTSRSGSAGPPAGPASTLAFGVTHAVGGMPALPGVAAELCAIVRGPVAGLDANEAACAARRFANGSFPGAGYANEFFTKERLAGAAGRGHGDGAGASPIDKLHIGTHLALRPGNMSKSWLLLGDGSHLPLATLGEIDLADVKLVTLSACQTGMAGATTDDGREVDGLPALLHRQGAQWVVATLWPIEDRTASRLMQDFYANLKQRGSGVPEALRGAQRAMLLGPRVETRHPYFWAAFMTSRSDR